MESNKTDYFRTVLSVLVGILGIIQWTFLDFTIVQRTLILLASLFLAAGICINKQRTIRIILVIVSVVLFTVAFVLLRETSDTFPINHFCDGLYPRDIYTYEKIEVDEDFDKIRDESDVVTVYSHGNSIFAGYRGESTYFFHDTEGLIMCYWIYKAENEKDYYDAHVKVKQLLMNNNHYKNPEIDDNGTVRWDTDDNNATMLFYHDDDKMIVVGWYSETFSERAARVMNERALLLEP